MDHVVMVPFPVRLTSNGPSGVVGPGHLDGGDRWVGTWSIAVRLNEAFTEPPLLFAQMVNVVRLSNSVGVPRPCRSTC